MGFAIEDLRTFLTYFEKALETYLITLPAATHGNIVDKLSIVTQFSSKHRYNHIYLNIFEERRYYTGDGFDISIFP